MSQSRKNSRRTRRNPTSKNSSAGVQHLVEAVHEHEIDLVVTDLDGTCYSFWYYFCPAMRTAIPAMAATLGLGKQDYDRISQEIGRVMAAHGTHEYPWVLEETWLRKNFSGSASEFRDRFVRPFWGELDHYRMKFLRPYDFVRETLQTLNQSGIPIVGLSDAPAHMAILRITQTGLDELFSGLYALDTEEPAAELALSEEELDHGKERVRRFGNTPHRMEIFRKLPKTFEKPSADGFKMIMSDFGITNPKKVLMVGDSLTKDGGVAKAIGCPYLWAWYGTILPAEYTEMIDVKFNPRGNTAQITTGHGVTYKPKVLPPMAAQLASYNEVLKHLGRQQNAESSGTILPPSARASGTQGPGH